jgi:glycosyltransferase involved in cell wall biosynthesis
MRLTVVTHYFPAHRGGIELVAAELARRLAAQHGVEVCWHASDCDAAPSIPGVQCEPASSWNGIEQRFGVPYPLWSPIALLKLGRAVRAADAVHLHDCLYLPNLVAYVTARLAGRPILVTQHVGMVPYRNPALRALLFAACHLLGRIVLGGASQVVFVSESVRRYFKGFVGFRSAPLLVPNGVDTALFHPVDEARRTALRGELGIDARAPLLLFVGRFVEKKGLPLLRELAQKLPEARWLFAGWGPSDPARWGLGNVTVMRERSAAQLAPLYQAADLLVLPSVGEGFPLVVQEAMACGTPALVGAETASSCPEAEGLLLGEATGGPETAARWMARLQSLLASRETLQQMRGAAAQFARENWSWEQCTARYAALLRTCARDTRRGGA